MKNPLSNFLWIPSCLAVLLFTVSVAGAQEATLDPSFRITKINAELISSPQTDSAMRSKVSKRKTRWIEIETAFGWAPQRLEENQEPYLDDLSVEFHVLLATRTKKYPMALISGETPLSNVGTGDPMFAAMYISPRSLERLFGGRPPSTANSAIENMAVLLKKGGQVVASQLLKGTQEFWKDPALAPMTIPGVLLKRSETPFAAHAWDYFEQEKIAP